MDYKEKYEMALEGIQEILGSGEDSIKMSRSQLRLQGIFPELKESEDERIRKAIHIYLDWLDGKKDYAPRGEYTINDMIDWIEKQGKHQKFRDSIQVGDKVTRNEDGVLVNLSQLARVAKPAKNQDVQQETLCGKCRKEQPSHSCQDITALGRCAVEHEQKPTAEEVLIKAGLKPYKDGNQWCVLLGNNIQEGICGFGNTIEDALYAFLKDLIVSQGEQKLDGTFVNVDDVRDDFIQEVYRVLDADSTNDRANQIIDAFDNLPTVAIEKQGEQKPTEWSEEDERNLQGIIDEIEANKNHAPDYDVATYDRFLSWLKSIKDRVQSKQEWSEEDEKCIRLSTDIIDSALRAGFCVQLDRDRCVDWFKSFKDKYTWKPSDEQMDALRYVTNFDYGGHKAILVSLYEQLKKLNKE